MFNSFNEISTKQYPLFLTIQKLLQLIDGTVK